jgi:hypothetical protein
MVHLSPTPKAAFTAVLNGDGREVPMKLIQLYPIALITALSVVSFGAAFPSRLFVQSGHCDRNLRQTSDHATSYRLRGDRCEGLYIRNVSQETYLASFTESFEQFDISGAKSLKLQWTAPSEGPVQLRANSLRQRFYYRMDSHRPVGNTSYQWSTDVLALLGVGKKDLGVVAWMPNLVAGKDVYLPISVTQGAGAGAARNYQVVLFPGEELTEVFVSIALLQQDGRPGPPIQKDKPLRYGYYPAERAISFNLLGLTTPGIHQLRIGATLRSGGSWTTEVLFYRRK